jgi:hypothetical protein
MRTHTTHHYLFISAKLKLKCVQRIGGDVAVSLEGMKVDELHIVLIVAMAFCGSNAYRQLNFG